jgi:hypothetical protein
MTQDRFKLITKFFHFVDNATDSYSDPKKLFKIHPILTYLNNKFQNVYIPGKNTAVDESLTSWKGRLSFKIYVPLKSSKFGIKTFELCEFSTGYLWNYTVYSGANTDINTAAHFGEKNKTTAIVVKLNETLLNKGHIVWMYNYYNSLDLATFFEKKHGTNAAGTLCPNIKNVPPTVKNSKLKKGCNFAT